MRNSIELDNLISTSIGRQNYASQLSVNEKYYRVNWTAEISKFNKCVNITFLQFYKKGRLP